MVPADLEAQEEALGIVVISLEGMGLMAVAAADGPEVTEALMAAEVQDLLEEKAGLMVEVEELDTTPLLEQKGLMEDLVALQEQMDLTEHLQSEKDWSFPELAKAELLQWMLTIPAAAAVADMAEKEATEAVVMVLVAAAVTAVTGGTQ